MLVKEWMTSDVMTIEEDTSMMKAFQIMKENSIRRLPVMRQGKLIGIVTDRDIKDASPSKATTLDIHELYYLLSELKIKDIIKKEIITIGPEETVEKATVKMLKYRISGLPVVDDSGSVVGIITQRDISKVLVSLSGIYRGGIQLAFNLEDRPGSIKEVADMIREHGGQMVSILTSYDKGEENCRNVYIRIKELPEDRIKSLTQELDKNFILLYMVKDSLKDV
jgi:acetoin utilization protein AcuB